MNKSKIKYNDIFYLEADINFQASEHQKELLRNWLNMYYLGTNKVNIMKNGKMVPRFPKKETPEFIDAHYVINASHILPLRIGFNLNGQVSDVECNLS